MVARVVSFFVMNMIFSDIPYLNAFDDAHRCRQRETRSGRRTGLTIS